MQSHLLKIIESIIKMLNLLKEQETKALKKASKKEIKANEDDGDDDDEDDDNDEDDDEDDDDMDDDMEDDDDDIAEDGHSADGRGHQSEEERKGIVGPGDSVHNNEEEKRAKTKKGQETESDDEEGNGGGLGFADDGSDEEIDEAVRLNSMNDNGNLV